MAIVVELAAALVGSRRTEPESSIPWLALTAGPQHTQGRRAGRRASRGRAPWWKRARPGAQSTSYAVPRYGGSGTAPSQAARREQGQMYVWGLSLFALPGVACDKG